MKGGSSVEGTPGAGSGATDPVGSFKTYQKLNAFKELRLHMTKKKYRLNLYQDSSLDFQLLISSNRILPF